MRYSIYNFETKKRIGTINEDSIRFLVKNRNSYKGIKQAFRIDRMFIQNIKNDDKYKELISFLETALEDNTHIIIECIDDFEESSIHKKVFMVGGCSFLILCSLFVIFIVAMHIAFSIGIYF